MALALKFRYQYLIFSIFSSKRIDYYTYRKNNVHSKYDNDAPNISIVLSNIKNKMKSIESKLQILIRSKEKVKESK